MVFYQTEGIMNIVFYIASIGCPRRGTGVQSVYHGEHTQRGVIQGMKESTQIPVESKFSGREHDYRYEGYWIGYLILLIGTYTGITRLAALPQEGGVGSGEKLTSRSSV